MDEMKAKYDRLKEERKKLVAEIHELKCKMTEIRSQEDDILRELEMEKALIKGEYDSEIAILNIEQRKKAELVEQAKKIEEEIKQLKEKQEARQNDMRDRVDIATMKVESALTQLDQELDITLNEIAKKKPLSPQKALPTESDSEQEGKPKRQHMAKVYTGLSIDS
ncbi:hypothetical protein MSG28_015769 [Choristoneura fumiferana]|uniref:Uncharacterized protein n=1 Tax=Choristoneura fumiferana TaxID=7141 RepID=A0ACC0KCL6_CHOFU|nr:hypothetical protein MSG28_015769 [Choristoneura fumiferana]